MQDKETKKTLIYMLVAGMALLVAWEPWRPAPADVSVPERVGQKLFPTFTDPLAAKSLEIVTFDEETAAVRDFRVVQTNGVWSIPSHSGYPADAKEHMAQAATSLMDLTVLSLASSLQGAQKTYGVITPDPEKLKVGMTGVGTRVTIRGEKEKVLADLVIGEAVKDAPHLRYVREVGRDPIYTVKLNTGEFSTKFGDWIEKDLLKLNAFDVREVSLNDYSTRTGVTPDGRAAWQIERRSETKLDFDDAKSQWSLVEMEEFTPEGEGSQVKLGEDETLNAEKLNEMKTALDDLQIIDVERKPAGLSQDLKASETFVNNMEARNSLAERGFLYAALPGEDPQIYSTEGEITATTKDGVQYALRFGDLAGVEATPEKKDEESPEGEAKSSGPSRYLFVTAQFDESQIPKPELTPIPGEEEANPEAAADKPADEPAAEEKPAEEAPAEKPEGEAAEPSVPETKTAAQDQAKSEAKAAEPAEAKPADAKPAEEAKPADEKAAADEPAEEKPAEAAAPATPEEQKRIEIRQENKRKQDEYDAAIKRGQDKVKELNERFADWYFIISDDVYKKIHLSRADIIQKKPVDTKDLGNLKELEQGLGQPPVQQPNFP